MNTDEFPFVSVVITGKNVADSITECLESVMNLDYPHYEVLFVDAGSSDGTLEIIRKMSSSNPIFRILIKDGSPAAGRNEGILNAKGEIIAFTDADCKVSKNWLLALVNCLIRHEDIASVGGPSLTPQKDQYFAKCVGLLFSTPFGSAGARNPGFYSVPRYIDHNPTCNVAIKREVFENVGLLKEGLPVGEDLEFDRRLQKKGYKLFYTPYAIVYHHRKRNLRQFAKQMFSYGFWRAKLGKNHRKIWTPIHFIPTAFILTLLIGGIVAFLNPSLILYYLYLLAVLSYVVFGLSFGILVAIKIRDPLIIIIMLPLGFFEHTSYGLGFLAGLLSISDKHNKKNSRRC